MTYTVEAKTEKHLTMELCHKAGKCYDTTERHILETKAWNHRGYAEGINQALAVIGFKHELMVELGELIS